MISTVTRGRLVAAGISLALIATACGSPTPQDEDPDQNQGAETQQGAENPLRQPEFESDDLIRMPVALVASAPPEDGTAVSDAEIARTEPFGCGSVLSIVETVPLRTEDPAVSALEYLLSLQSSTHVRAGYSNPLAGSAELSVESVELHGGQVTVALGGVPVSPGYCESWQILKQIETTARAATGAASAEVLVGDVPLAQTWGLEDSAPLTITEIN